MLPNSRSEALAVGSAEYQTVKPCKRGHTTPRMTISGACIQCKKQAAKDWYQRVQQALAAVKEQQGA